tara:strand:- start:1065 stop:1481 length:417 start_codon:yes stop_codon:yes gene_type:complete
MILIATLNHLPMPPSINESYIQVGIHRVSSSSHKKFKLLMQRWGLLNYNKIQNIKKKLDKIDGSGRVCLSFVFKFPASKLTLKNTTMPKKLDTSNRIKSSEDAVCKLLGFDDRFVFKLIAEKVEGKIEEFDCSVYNLD